MYFVVCIKQVPETTDVKIDPVTNTLMREGVASIINPFDKFAIEEAIRQRDKHGGKVTVITMGPLQAKEALKEALAMGADEAVLLSDRAFAGADTLATSYTLARAIRKLGKADLVLCGKQAIDGDTAQVGAGIAQQLGIPQLTYVRKVTIEGSILTVERALQDCYEVVRCKLPALVTCVKELNEPRLPTLRGIMMASQKEITVWGARDIAANPARIGLNGSPTRVVTVFTPTRRGKGGILSGDVDEAVDKLVEKLLEAQAI